MVSYVVLAHFTDQGIRNAKESPKRAEAFAQLAKTFGVTVREFFWTQGQDMTLSQSSMRQMNLPPWLSI
jgi:uncharacterized protein with GYD domain